MTLPAATDFLVIGGGIVGMTMALALKEEYTDATVTLIEKEHDLGAHASGRNSGVLHAGFYYTADSLKARFTRDGNTQLTEYCLDREIPINRCGKLVVAQDETELPLLDELLERGRANGVILQDLGEQEVEEIEPRARTCQRALFAPTTASVAPRDIIEALRRDLDTAGVVVALNVAYRRAHGAVVGTTAGDITAGYVVNAAGLYADKIARDFGFSERYAILPFKGLYLHLSGLTDPLRVHVYPVPDLANPFLGVHLTVTVDHRVKIGPTAIPALWREHYRGLERFRMSEFLEISRLELGLFLRNDFGFRRLAYEELKKHARNYMVESAKRLADLDEATSSHWGEPGIRAQLVDLDERRLEMDFIHEGDERSFHVLNAVSPAFTCALPFSRFLVERIGVLLK
jgi:L-2-hydroxyglutarate oxidase LhgO